MKKNKISKKIGLTIFLCVLISIIGAQAYLVDDILDYGKNESTPKTSDGETIRITITNPNSNTVWEAGTSQFIKWYYTGSIDYVNITVLIPIYYYHKTVLIGENIPNDPTGESWYEWAIPSDYRHFTNYKIMVRAEGFNTFTGDFSEEFTIIEEHKSITVTNPTDNTVWEAGSSYWVNWESTGYSLFDSPINIELFKGESFIYRPALWTFTDLDSFYYTLPNDLLYGDDYYIKIVDRRDSTIFGKSPYFTITEDPTPPSKPTLLSPDNGGFVTIRQPIVEWNPVPRAVEYKIQFSKSPTFSYPVGYSTCWTADTQIQAPSSLTEGTKYWRVCAKNSVGIYGEWSDTWSYIIDTIRPARPTLLEPLDGAKINTETPTLKWLEVPDAVLYQVYIDDHIELWDPLIQHEFTTNTQLTTVNLEDGIYYWTLHAQDEACNWGYGPVGGPWSFTIDTIPPATPTLLSPSMDSVINDDTVIFQWTDIADAVEYGIQVYMNTDFSSPIIDTTLTDVQYSVSGLYDGDYYWRVNAKDDVGNWCSWSSFNMFTVDAILSIYIDDDNTEVNWSWAVNQWWCTGSGIETDPYVIKDITINAENSGSGIEIRNSDVYFVIENCYAYNSGTDKYDAGIKLYNVKNGKLINNDCSDNNYYGICLMHCTDITITGNDMQSNEVVGLYLYFSSYNTITSNTANENTHGFFLFTGSNNFLIDNLAIENSYGFGMYSSDSNSLTHNTALNNLFKGFFLTGNASNNIISNNNFIGNNINALDDGTNNQWDDGVIGNYWDDYSGIDFNDDGIGDSPYLISGSAGSLDNYPIWDDGENTPIGEDVELEDPVSGISIKFSDITESGTTSISTSDTGNPPPSGFSVSGQYYDITTTASYSGVITIAIPYNVGNPRLMHWSTEIGQWEDITTVIDTTNNILYGNISSLSEFVVMTGMSPKLYIDSDFTFTEDIYGPIIITADNIVIDGNGFKLKGGGTGTGFYLNGRTGVTIKDVAIERWTYGFYLSFSDFNTITENRVTSCFYGFYISSSSNNVISNNIAYQNTYIAFFLRSGSEFNILNYNTAIENPEAAFYLFDSSDNNFLSDNIVINNGKGFHLTDSNYNTFLNNLADGSTYCGFTLSSSSYNIFIGNIVSNANYGFKIFRNSNDNILSANNAEHNWCGVFIHENSNNNLVYHNNFINNYDRQIWVESSINNYWYHPELLEGNYYSDYNGLDDGSGTEKHAIAGDGIGDTNIPWPRAGYDPYPFIDEKSWISIDSDNDGILDVYEEVIYGTDPLNPNTDGDGLSDGEEVLILDSDPLNYMDPAHLPIFIDGDATGVGAHNWTWALKYKVCTGSGTLNDPYIIENFQIITSSSTGIHIIDSSEYFIIRNCYIEALSYGIYIDNVADGTAKIINNTCRNVINEFGISLWSSAYAEVINNTCINCIRGIMIGQSPYSAIINNTCKGGQGVGIIIGQSDYSKVANNTCNNNYQGIYIFSSNCLIIDNICNNNFKEGIYMAFYGSHGTSDCIVSNNYLESNRLHGIYIAGGSSNIIHHNIFIDNNPSGLSQAQDDGSNNQWDDGTIGNYWNDYLGVDFDDDGIGDTPNIILGTAGSQDNYPIWDDGCNTPVGECIKFNDQDSGITLIFYRITSGGTTKISIQDIGPDPPSGFLLTGTYYDISTTASFAGTIEIAIPYNETLVKGNEKNLKLKHWDSKDEKWIDVTTWVDTDANIIYGEVESLSIFALFKEITLPSITVETPREGQALQDGIVFTGKAEDESRVIWVNLTIREDDGANGIFIHDDFENMPAIYNEITKEWQLFFDTTELLDGYYMLIVEASDIFDQIGLNTTSFSIRNWAILVLLPSTEQSNPGRTMPVKYSLRVAEAVDPNTPFVYNEELNIVIYAFDNPGEILQNATFGDVSLNYRIDSIGELYITNFKTLKTPEVYTVEIWRKNFLVGSFTFETVDKKAGTSVDTDYDWIDGSTLVFSAGIAFVNISIVWISAVFLASTILWRKRNKKYNN